MNCDMSNYLPVNRTPIAGYKTSVNVPYTPIQMLIKIP